MITTDRTLASTTDAPAPLERILTAALVIAPLISLAADSTYAARGWDDPTAGVLHVLGAIGYGFVVLRAAAWLPRSSRLAAAIVVVGLIGLAGNVAYGFEAIHMSFGDTQLVDRSGAANLIKPLGLCFPMSLALIAAAVTKLGRRVPAALIAVSVVLWPIAHICNIKALAVIVNLILVAAFASLAATRTAPASTGTSRLVV